MSLLAQLKLTTAKKSSQITPVMQRRQKLLAKLREQVHLAQAKQNGSAYAPTKLRTITDAETGDRKTIQVPKRIKPWWFDSNGKTCIAVRYGAKTLTLGSKGQTAIELAGVAELVPTLELIKQAVEVGELDAQLQTASGATKANFKK
jgi:hypothetical protein